MDRARLGLAGAAREDVLVSLASFGLPDGGTVPPGVTEAAVAMRGHPDVFTPWSEPTDTEPLLARGSVLTHEGVMVAAADELARRGIGTGDRFALLDPDPLSDVLALAGPLVCAGSVVMVAHPESGDLAATLREEGVSGGGG